MPGLQAHCSLLRHDSLFPSLSLIVLRSVYLFSKAMSSFFFKNFEKISQDLLLTHPKEIDTF